VNVSSIHRGERHSPKPGRWPATGRQLSAVEVGRETRDRHYQAGILTHLGDAHHDSGDTDAARAAWQGAFAILDDLAHPDADRVRTKLHRLAA
jgi:predicted negative regulator of RcsB-dependent stress response